MICSRNGDETGCCVPNDMMVYILFIVHVSHVAMYIIDFDLSLLSSYFAYPKPVGRTLFPSNALIALDFPLLVRPKNTTLTSFRATTSLIIVIFDRCSAILVDAKNKIV